MKDKPIFSICIPVYNKMKYLRRCLESIAKQKMMIMKFYL